MSPVVQAVTNILSFGTVLMDVFVVLLFVILLTPLSETKWGKSITAFFGDHAILFSFLVAFGSVVGSLIYSEYAHFAPCELCWIERGLLYPQAIILLIALVAYRKKFAQKLGEFARIACLILSGIDFPVSAYHTYLQLGGGEIVPCSATGPSCQYVYFIQYGYVTIPSMALTAAALILVFMLLKRSPDGAK